MPEASSTLLIVHPPADVLPRAPVTSSRRLPVNRRASAVSTSPGSTTHRASNLERSASAPKCDASRSERSGRFDPHRCGPSRSTRRGASPHRWAVFGRSLEPKLPRPPYPVPDAFVAAGRPPEDWVVLDAHPPTRIAVAPRGARYDPAPFTASRPEREALAAPVPGEPEPSTPFRPRCRRDP